MFSLPCYLVTCGTSATTGFHHSSRRPGALPTQRPGNTAVANFECVIPSSAGAPAPARVSLYGHGLFGSYAEVEAPPVQALAVGNNMVLCGTDRWGLAQTDEGHAAGVVSNLDGFPVIVDRLQQSVLNALFLGRLMINPQGFAASPEFQAAGRTVINTSQLYYDGNSQGGIIGGVVTAVSPDVRQAVLGVTGMDCGNMLLGRSTDFTLFSQFLANDYTDRSMYPVELDLLDQLWDRADPDGYAPYITRPLPNTPSSGADAGRLRRLPGQHDAAAAEARTIGARAVQPALDPVRARDRNLFWGIPAVGRYPYHGSAIEIWDSGPGRVQPPRWKTSHRRPGRRASIRTATRATPRLPRSRSLTSSSQMAR